MSSRGLFGFWSGFMRVSGAERTRTSDARFRKPTLYPLSYSPVTDYDTTSVKSLSMRSTSQFNYLSREQTPPPHP